MEFGLTETQELVRSSAREFLADSGALTAARSTHTDAGAWRQGWKDVASLGWPGLSISERWGGAGMGFGDLCVLLGALARSLAPWPLFETTVLGAGLIERFGTEEQRDRLLPQLADGDAVATAAVTGVNASATVDSSGALDGEWRFVPAGAAATHFLLRAGANWLIVPADAAGVEVTPIKIASGEPWAHVRCHSVKIPDRDRLGGGSHAADEIAEHALLRSAAARAVQMADATSEVLDRTVAYVSERRQFGHPVGSFQAVQHKLADMAIAVRSASHLGNAAAWALEEGAGDAALRVARAKAFADRRLPAACWDAHQCHGAIGFTWEHDLHLFTRRVLTWRTDGGDAAFWSTRAADHILGGTDGE